MPGILGRSNNNKEGKRGWRFIPGFLKKTTGACSKKPDVVENEIKKIEAEEILKVTDKASNEVGREVIDNVEVLDGKSDEVSDNAKDQQEKNRFSWTYGSRLNGRYHSVQRKKGLGQGAENVGIDKPFDLTCELTLVKLDEADEETKVKPLQRGESFPGSFTNGNLSKREARKRLQSWKRTTIVRKNSEHQ